jgi:membrane associated rhomboid family serine protease
MNNQYYRPTGFRILPPVVKNLLILNALFFLATISLDRAFHIDLTYKLGLHYFASEAFSPYQFITYMFMHGSMAHIFFNMFALWMFGNALENIWGPRRFLVYYIITGIGAALVHYIIFYFEVSPVLAAVDAFQQAPSLKGFEAFIDSSNFQVVSQEIKNNFNGFINEYNHNLLSDPQRSLQLAMDFMSQYRIDYLNAPVVIGASGAVFGILLAFGMTFPNSLIYLYFAIPIRAKYFVILYGVLELFSGIYNTGSNVAHFAHLGGMFFGYLVLLYWKKHKRY